MIVGIRRTDERCVAKRLRQIKGFFYLYSEYPRPVPRDFWMSSTPQPLCYEPIAAPLILFRIAFFQLELNEEGMNLSLDQLIDLQKMKLI